MYHKATTLTEFIINEERKLENTTGSLTLLLTIIENAVKVIASHIKKTGLVDIIGAAGGMNSYGEEVQRLDEFSNRLMVDTLLESKLVYAIGSEEIDDIILSENYRGDYVVFFDPLDGSGNIATNVSMGTIFSIYKAPPLTVRMKDVHKQKEVLKKGAEQVVSGYALYGSSVIFVYTAGQGVNGFTLDPSIGSFLLSHPNMTIPEEGKIYSINEGMHDSLDTGHKNYLKSVKNMEYKLRYIGCMVADVHRTLISGGIFMYPANGKDKEGKLRLMFEVNPMAYIIEQAGGKAVNSDGKSPLDHKPESVSDRFPIALGSKKEVERYLSEF